MTSQYHKNYLNVFKQRFEEEKPHISHSLSDDQLIEFLGLNDEKKFNPNLDLMLDRFEDYLLSQGLTDEVQL